MEDIIRGKAYVLGDNIDTDQIIPAEYLSYNPADPDERKMFGHYALVGVPDDAAGLPDGHIPFVDLSNPSNTKSEYSIIVAGNNFGCGSSREHAPLALAEAGVKAIVAHFYARIFFRNSVNGGYLVPFERADEADHGVRTGDEVEIRISDNVLVNLGTGQEIRLNPLGDIAPIVEAGGVFEYARRSGML